MTISKNDKIVEAEYKEKNKPIGNINETISFIAIKLNNVLTYIDINDILDIVFRGTITNGAIIAKAYDVVFQDGRVVTTTIEDNVFAKFIEEKEERRQRETNNL